MWNGGDTVRIHKGGIRISFGGGGDLRNIVFVVLMKTTDVKSEKYQSYESTESVASTTGVPGLTILKVRKLFSVREPLLFWRNMLCPVFERN